jgi:uncharacterized membrane protein
MNPMSPEATTLHPVGLLIMVAAALSILLVPRRWAPVPLLATACFVTVGQVVMVGPLDFTVHRIVLLAGWVRVIVRGEWDLREFNAIDKLIVAWAGVNLLAHTLLVGTMGAFINRLGFTYNALGFYFLFRMLVVDMADIGRLFRALAALAVPLAAAMLVEDVRQRNLFAAFGGVPPVPVIRDGAVRVQAAFRHPILAGSFGATVLPLVVSLWWDDAVAGWRVVVGGMAAFAVALLPSSSGPLMSVMAAMAAMAAWKVRYRLWAFRWAGVAGLVGVQLFMNAPIWFLIDRVGDVVGGEGYHRSLLIDQAVRHLDEWWLLGTTYTAHWVPYVLPINPDMADITNYYLRMGVDGGLATMGLFVLLIAMAYRAVGRTARVLEEHGMPVDSRVRVWALGAALTAHVFAFISVSYFDQTVVFWYMLLAVIATADDIGRSLTRREPLMVVEEREG